MPKERFDIDKEQEQIVSNTLQIIRNAFNLNEWSKKSGGRDGIFEYRYYLHKNAIWRQTAFTPQNPCEYSPEEIGITEYSQCRTAQSINALVARVWFSELSDLSHQHAVKKMQEFLSVDSSEPMFEVSMWINHSCIIFPLPRSYILSNHYPIPGKIHNIKKFQVIEFKTETLSTKQIIQCIFNHNLYQNALYEAKIQYCKKIHQFICDHHLNEQLNLESPPFSPELYEIQPATIQPLFWTIQLLLNPPPRSTP